MKFSKLVPNVFYADIADGVRLFVDCLEFVITHDERASARPFCVVERDSLRVNIFQDVELAETEHPEFRLVTDNIEEVYDRISSRFPDLLHPNLSKITLRPWGAKEFAIMDMQLGIIFQEW